LAILAKNEHDESASSSKARENFAIFVTKQKLKPTLNRLCCKLGCDGIVSKRLGSPYRSGRSQHWVKVKNPNAPAVKREAEEDWR
jgi:ATP-dependent DNA ligase